MHRVTVFLLVIRAVIESHENLSPFKTLDRFRCIA